MVMVITAMSDLLLRNSPCFGTKTNSHTGANQIESLQRRFFGSRQLLICLALINVDSIVAAKSPFRLLRLQRVKQHLVVSIYSGRGRSQGCQDVVCTR